MLTQDVIVREADCGTDDGIIVSDIKDGNEIIEKMKDRLIGRTACEDIVNPETGEVIVEKNNMIRPAQADIIEKVGIEKVKIRSVLKCRAKIGVCAKLRT